MMLLFGQRGSTYNQGKIKSALCFVCFEYYAPQWTKVAYLTGLWLNGQIFQVL